MTLRQFLESWWYWLTTLTWVKVQMIADAPLDTSLSVYGDVLGAALIWGVIGFVALGLGAAVVNRTVDELRENYERWTARRAAKQRD